MAFDYANTSIGSGQYYGYYIEMPPLYITNAPALATTPSRRLALAIVEEAIGACLPARLLRDHLQADDGALWVGGRRYPLAAGRLWVLGAGKAAAGMAAAVEDIVGVDRVHGGLVITVPGAPGKMPRKVVVRHGEHPVPGDGSVSATRALLDEAERVRPGDLALCLISGGASALLAAPAEAVTLAEKQEVTRLLLRSGASIDEMNAVRKHLSAVKGGQLARRLAPAVVTTLALSDVVSGRLDVIGSGPTVPDSSTYGAALAALDGYGLRTAAPAAVRLRLERGAAELLPETPKPGDPCFAGSIAQVIGSPASAATAATAAAQRAGLRAELLTATLSGEAQAAARRLGQALRARPDDPDYPDYNAGPLVLVAAGEVTVTVRGDGNGGRCQELAAALIPELAGTPWTVACVATDGRDYLEGVGGALVDGATAGLADGAGLSVAAHLARSDSNALHRRLGSLLEMAPTGTNLCDLLVMVRG